MRESGLDRTLRYFVWMAQLYVLYTAGLGIAMVVYMQIINGSVDLWEMITALPGTLMCLAGMTLFLTGVSAGQQWYSMLISLGCRRRNVFLGSIIMDILYMAECLILYEFLIQILSTDMLVFSVPAVLGVYLIICGISKLTGAAVLKLGKAAYIGMFIVIFLGIAVMTAAYLIYVFGEGEPPLLILAVSRLSGFSRSFLLMFGGAVIFAAANAGTWCILRNYEVRA